MEDTKKREKRLRDKSLEKIIQKINIFLWFLFNAKIMLSNKYIKKLIFID
jgi:hypothetical protein